MKNHTVVDQTTQPVRAAVVHVENPRTMEAQVSLRGVSEKLAEAVNLAKAVDLDVVFSDSLMLKKVNPKTIIGKGKVEEYEILAGKEGIEVFIFNTSLSPAQQRNLEVGLQAKVIDRSYLILEIFAKRAQTKAGRLQVALAREMYQQGRLVRAWTHLERQRGGMGKTGGPGERQIELDRRMIHDRMQMIKRDLATVEKERDLQRRGRKKSALPVVSLVGYTNAGKSTLFNALIASSKGIYKEEAMVKDMLFATLDPLMRKMKLPNGQEIILSDTVGFVSDLPHQLVDAFASTLEEVKQADLLLHVHDTASEEYEAQAKDVRQVLAGLEADEVPCVEVANKIDISDRIVQKAVEVSATEGTGIEELLAAIETALEAGNETLHLSISVADGKRLAWLHAHGRIVSQDLEEDMWQIEVILKPEDAQRFHAI